MQIIFLCLTSAADSKERYRRRLNLKTMFAQISFKLR